MPSQIETLDALREGDALDGTARLSLSLKSMMMRVAYYILEWTGTNTAGSTVQPGDLGEIKLFKGDRSDAQLYLDIHDLFRLEKERNDNGPTETSVDDGNITLRTRLSNALLGLLGRNGYHVEQDEDVQLVLDHNSSPANNGVLDNKADSLSYAIKPVLSQAVYEGRLIRWLYTNVIRGATGQKEVEGINEENIAWIFIDDPDGAVTNLSLDRVYPNGRETVYEEAPIAEVQREYDHTSIPAGTSNLYGVPVMERPQLPEAYNEGVDLSLTVGSTSDKIRVIYASVADSTVPTSGQGVQSRSSSLQSLE